jgi:DNA-binding transcriptional regulator YiaG
MPNINAVLNLQIRRLARREISSGTRAIKKATGHYRREIAALKRELARLGKVVGEVRKQLPEQAPAAPEEMVQKARLRIDGLKAHRGRLGLSAKDYGKLIGVSALTIYNWEAGKSKPRRSQLPRIVAVRGIGKREAMQRLGMTPASDETVDQPIVEMPKRQKGKRGSFSQTAQEMILGLLKGGRVMTTAQVNAAWKKAGRKGSADVTLGAMIKARDLKRTKLKGQRGSEYRAT